jgi:hypothetical protein
MTSIQSERLNIQPSDINLNDVLLLPDQQRQILNWLTRHPNSSLETIANYLEIEANRLQPDLDALLQEGWIESRRSNGQSVYALRSIFIHNADQPSQEMTQSKGLVVILTSSGQDAITPGESFRLSITITNKGLNSAIIDVLLDELGPEIQPWCTSLRECLALGAGQSGEVVFWFQVPVTAQPALYNYRLIVDAPQHYPEETPIRYPQCLQILPAAQDAAYSSDPTFIIQPATGPNQPLLLQPGGGIPVQILVQNRSDRVDRFRLTCLDLPPNWFQVTYPQSDSGFGIVLASDSLKLNPGEQGVILFLISPPIDALAGTQVSTLRLHSETYPDVRMSDWVYLQITANHLLQSELRTIVNKVRQKSGLFQVRLTNLGNTPRELNLAVQNLEESLCCLYDLDQTQVLVAPKATVGINLAVKPKSRWQRPFYGGAKVLNFAVELEDRQQLPLASDRLTNFIILEARPWWQLLPFVVMGLFGVGAFFYLIWWLLIRIPAPPKILDFAPESNLYEALNDEAVRLSWRITVPKRLKTLTIQGTSPDGKALILPIVYDFTQGLPEGLKAYCTLEQELICRSVRTSALKPGDYVFSLSTTAKAGRGSASDIYKSSVVKIEPIPKPQILTFTSTQSIYQEASLTPIASASTVQPNPNQIALNWTINNPRQIQALHLIAKSPEGVVISSLKQFDLSQGIPVELKPFCSLTQQLTCRNLPTGDRRPGSYIYELATIAKGDTAITLQKTDVVKLLPKAPKLLNLTINGQAVLLPKYLVAIEPNQAITTLLLAWEIEASDGSKVELLPAPGSIPLKGSLPFPLNPTPGSLTLTLQITSPTGQQLARSIVIETYDPNATDPSVQAAAAAAAAIANANKPAETPATDSSSGGGGGASQSQGESGELLPLETPPRSN